MPRNIFPEFCGVLSLQWRHNGHDGVSNHQPHHCLLNRHSGADQRKHQSTASLAFVRGIHRSPVNSPQWPVTRKMFPFHDVIMFFVSIVRVLVWFRSYLPIFFRVDWAIASLFRLTPKETSGPSNTGPLMESNDDRCTVHSQGTSNAMNTFKMSSVKGSYLAAAPVC